MVRKKSEELCHLVRRLDKLAPPYFAKKEGNGHFAISVVEKWYKQVLPEFAIWKLQSHLFTHGQRSRARSFHGGERFVIYNGGSGMCNYPRATVPTGPNVAPARARKPGRYFFQDKTPKDSSVLCPSIATFL